MERVDTSRLNEAFYLLTHRYRRYVLSHLRTQAGQKVIRWDAPNPRDDRECGESISEATQEATAAGSRG